MRAVEILARCHSVAVDDLLEHFRAEVRESGAQDGE
jgi:hypothetical protein